MGEKRVACAAMYCLIYNKWQNVTFKQFNQVCRCINNINGIVYKHKC